MKNQNLLPTQLLIFIISAVLFLPFLGNVHLFDWDENIFAESAREMLITGNFYKVQSNYLPFEEKPPFFFWLQSAAMVIFGENEFAARFPNALAGGVTLVLLFTLGARYFSQKFGLYWAVAYLGSFLPHFYFRTALIDPIFNLFIFSGIFTLAIFVSTEKAEKRTRYKRAALAGLLIGFAILTKGPVALLVTAFTALAYMIATRNFRCASATEILAFTVPMLIVAFAWFGIEAFINGPWFIREFILYQIEVFKKPTNTHKGPFFFHFLVLLIGCFPVSLYIFSAFKKQDSDNTVQKNIKLIMILVMAVVLLIFSIVKTKLVHYSSLCYFPISFLAAYVLDKHDQGLIRMGKSFRYLLQAFGVLIGIILFSAALILYRKDSLLEQYAIYIKDPFALGNLSTPLQLSGWEVLGGLFFTAVFIISGYLIKKDFSKGSLILFASTIITVQFTTYALVPEIETMVQGAAIDFYKEKGKEDAYLATYGFKSFGYLFYGKKMPDYRPESLDEQWLLNGPIDKPVYMVAKVNHAKNLDENPNFTRLFEKSGYVFFKRELPE